MRYSKSSSRKTWSGTKANSYRYSDEYDAADYGDYEDFYEDHYDDFDGIDDAETYWEQYH